jgi:hypothetical protein
MPPGRVCRSPSCLAQSQGPQESALQLLSQATILRSNLLCPTLALVTLALRLPAQPLQCPTALLMFLLRRQRPPSAL